MGITKRRAARLVAALSALLIAGGLAGWFGWQAHERRQALAGVERIAQQVASGLHTGTLPDAIDVTDRAGAEKRLAVIYRGMGEVRPAVTVRDVRLDADGESGTARLEQTWTFHAGQPAWTYATQVRARHTGTGWVAQWSDEVVAPGLRTSEGLRAARLTAERGEILGDSGKPLVMERPVVRVGLDRSRLTDDGIADSAALLPINSEHVALHQALRSGAREEVRRLVLTASGGPFLHRDAATWEAIRPEEALRHPTWSMGAKITIDSATLMNKGLELIEASHLFALGPERIDVIVHPQSIVHSLVEYRDGSWVAQLARNDMALPIQYALSLPERWENSFPRLDLAALGSLTFLALDDRRFPSVRLARQALASGESAPAVLNAANEEAVHAFLGGRLAFPAIFDTVAEVLDLHCPVPVPTLEDALAWDDWGRRRAHEVLARA